MCTGVEGVPAVLPLLLLDMSFRETHVCVHRDVELADGFLPPGTGRALGVQIRTCQEGIKRAANILAVSAALLCTRHRTGWLACILFFGCAVRHVRS